MIADLYPCHGRQPRSQGTTSSATAGYSLLELVAATALVSGMLVPSLALMRNGIELSVETDQRQLLANYAVHQLEQRMALVAATWATGTTAGDFASEGFPNIRYTSACSDLVADGGIVGLLMDIRVTTYNDTNEDDALDTDELSCTYRTKLGKFATYESMIP